MKNRLMTNTCPAPGGGVHSWILAEANRCRKRGLPPAEAERLIIERMTRRPSPANEVRTTVAKSYGDSQPRAWERLVPQNLCRAQIPTTELRFDLSKLKAVADNVPARNWRHWLWERSPKLPQAMNAFSFLAHLYRPGELVHVFDKFDGMEGKTPLLTLQITSPMDCRVSQRIREGGRFGKGIWFLCNPVDGQWHDTGDRDEKNKPRFSCRNHQAITSWRYAVLESDQAPEGMWLAFIAQLPLRIAAIYRSGGRSVHSLIRLDAPSKAAWDSLVCPVKRSLKVLGADPACLTAVRLTRLPQCWRPHKNGFQQLLYLCPDPPLARLVDLPILNSRAGTLARYRQESPRWNPSTEAFI